MSLQLRRRIARGLALALLASQLTLAAYACPALSQALAGAANIAAGAAASTPAAERPCGDTMGSADAQATNLCAEHCRIGQQSDHSASLVLPAYWPGEWGSPAWTDIDGPRLAAPPPDALAASTRPHAIVHCVRRT